MLERYSEADGTLVDLPPQRIGEERPNADPSDGEEDLGGG